ncbi:MAG: FHA domain-containing protein [Planctomycetota bacterium]
MTSLLLKSAVFSDGHLRLTPGDLPLTIGRSHRADVTINDQLLSRIHCEIRLSADGGFEIVDHESTNLTIVNQQDVTEAKLRTGDVILIGDTELLVEVESQDADIHEKTTREISVVRPSKSSH